ncbi:MAG: DinB family protein [Chloroflexota bacterium]
MSPGSSPTPDPVRPAEAYRQSLLAALGDDDPAVAQAQAPAALRALVRETGPRLRARPEPGEWSALECIGHIVDGELVVAGRYRWILAHDEPEIIGYDQAL